MRRQVVSGVVGVAGVVLAIGTIVWGAQQGWFVGEKPKRLLNEALASERQGNVPQAQAKLEELVATYPDSLWVDDALLKLGQLHEAQQQLTEAQSMYNTLMERFPESSLVEEAEQRLGAVNVNLLLSPVAGQQDQVYTVKPGDTLGEIATAHGSTVDLIKRANQLSSDVIRSGQRLKVPSGKFEIVVDKSQKQLLLTKDGQFVKRYEIATGREDSTPEGSFKIVNRIPNPTWYKSGAVVPADSPENILGTRWLGFDKPGYGIHGTVDEQPIQQQQTSGCVRMTNRDVEELFDIVPVGTRVTIVN